MNLFCSRSTSEAPVHVLADDCKDVAGSEAFVLDGEVLVAEFDANDESIEKAIACLTEESGFGTFGDTYSFDSNGAYITMSSGGVEDPDDLTMEASVDYGMESFLLTN